MRTTTKKVARKNRACSGTSSPPDRHHPAVVEDPDLVACCADVIKHAILGRLVANANHDERRSAEGLTPTTGYRSATTRHFLSHKRATGRLLRSIAVGAIAMLLPLPAPTWSVRWMIGWDAFALMLLAQAWWILLRSDAHTTKQRASDEDPGRDAVFLIAVVSSVISVSAAMLVIRITRSQSSSAVWEVFPLAGVALSWLLTHTSYTFRYAHLYYGGTRNGGLIFPGTSTPADMDFAYYAFTLGMAFQVSDVQVEAPDIRETTFWHALISFAFNTTILALALNVIFGLVGGQ
jgi:uncharacterized membrane protein